MKLLMYHKRNNQETLMRKPQQLLIKQLELFQSTEIPENELPQTVKEKVIELLKQWLIGVHKQRKSRGENNG